MKKSIPEIREREGNEKIHSHNSGRESEAFILGNGREREFPLTPGNHILLVKGGKILATPIKRGPFLSETRAFVTHCVWV